MAKPAVLSWRTWTRLIPAFCMYISRVQALPPTRLKSYSTPSSLTISAQRSKILTFSSIVTSTVAACISAVGLNLSTIIFSSGCCAIIFSPLRLFATGLSSGNLLCLITSCTHSRFSALGLSTSRTAPESSLPKMVLPPQKGVTPPPSPTVSDKPARKGS